VIQAVRGRRSATPNPAIYFVGAGTGIVVGLALTVALGWAWWSPAVAVLVGLAIVWLIFLSTALWGRGRAYPPGYDLRGAVMQELAPKRAAARDDRLREKALRTLPFEPYGLPATWENERWAGGTSSEGSAIVSAELGFGDQGLDGRGVHLRVETAVRRDDVRRSRTLHALAHSLWRSELAMPEGLRAEQAALWFHRRDRELAARPEPRWTPVVLRVDGRPVRFDVLAEGASWVARGTLADRVLTLRGRSWPLERVELVTVRDIEPYLAGWRRLTERRRGEHGRRHAS
jgi:hypothetical protein